MGLFEAVGGKVYSIAMCFTAWKWNFRYIRVINSCNWNDFVVLMDDILTLQSPFRLKRYIWNIIRGKTFYKELSHYVTGYVERIMRGELENGKEKMNDIERLIHEIVTTEKSERALNNFIWSVTKKVPLLTIDTIPYMSNERIINILLGEKTALADTAIEPFISVIIKLRDQLRELDDMATDLTKLIGGE